MKRHFLLLCAALLVSANLFAQGERKDRTAVTYEEIYDEPYSINKLFVQFQPLYGELFVTNVNAGFGLEATYYMADKADFKAHFRKTYTQKFYDFSRDLAAKTSNVDNGYEVYNYFEVGGTYHFRDFEQSSKTKMFLYKKSYRGDKWAARVPLNADVPCKVRTIYGGRLGGIVWNSATDVTRAMVAQNLTNTDFKDINDPEVSLPVTEMNYQTGREQAVDVFSNISSVTVYAGGSITWIKNVAVSFDKFEEGIDDLMFTAFFDLLYAPVLKVDDIVYTPPTDPSAPLAVPVSRTFDVSPLKLKSFGFRAGIEGKFNRTWGWAYGGEVGYRPSIEGRTFYALLKISFPVFATNLDYKVESFGK